jgi:hypothetical protein
MLTARQRLWDNPLAPQDTMLAWFLQEPSITCLQMSGFW